MRIDFLWSESRSLCLDITLCSLRAWNVGAIWLHLIIHLCVCKWCMCIWKCHRCTWGELISHSLSYRTCTRFRTYQLVVNECTSCTVCTSYSVYSMYSMFTVCRTCTRLRTYKQKIVVNEYTSYIVQYVHYVHCISYLFNIWS